MSDGAAAGGGKKHGWIRTTVGFLGKAAFTAAVALGFQGLANRLAPNATKKLLGG